MKTIETAPGNAKHEQQTELRVPDKRGRTAQIKWSHSRKSPEVTIEDAALWQDLQTRYQRVQEQNQTVNAARDTAGDTVDDKANSG